VTTHTFSARTIVRVQQMMGRSRSRAGAITVGSR
jgi:hypothetical protein